MTGYLTRLASQTGLTISRAPASPVPMPSTAPIEPAADLVEESIQTEAPFPATTPETAAAGIHLPARNESSEPPGIRRDSKALEIVLDERSAIPSAVTPCTDVPADSQRIFPTPTELESCAESIFSSDPPAGTPVPRVYNPVQGSPEEVIQEVMNWVASDQPPANFSENESPKTEPISGGTRAMRTPEQRVATQSIRSVSEQIAPRVATRQAAAPEPASDPVFIHIGAIHLTIESPAEKPSVVPVATARTMPNATSPAAAAGSSAAAPRLWRHYLRSD